MTVGNWWTGSRAPWRQPAQRTGSSRRAAHSCSTGICLRAAARLSQRPSPAILPRVRSRSNLRVPDVAVTCTPVEGGQIALPEPLLIVEILSPTNESETWEDVWTYVSIPSVLEILVLRSASISADLLRRQPDGTWPNEPAPVGRDGTVQLDSIDLNCALAEFYIGTYLAR